MTPPTLRRPLAAWRFLLDLVRSATQPAANAAWCDERVERLAAGSGLARALRGASHAWHRAYSTSLVVSAARTHLSLRVPNSMVERVRALGCTVATAAATTLALSALGTEHDPLLWVLPAAAGVVAGVVILAARPIARALGHYDS